MRSMIPNPRIALILVPVLTTLLTTPTVSVAEDEGDFHPQRFEKKRTVHVNGSPDEVYALLDPGKRHLWSGKKDTRERLFEGWGETLSGAMYFSVDKHHGYRWEVMAEDDPENRLMRWILFMPGTELLVAEFRCAESSQGGTDLTMIWSVIGLSPDGNQAVKEFFDTDSFENQVDKTGERLNQYLE